MFGGVGRMVTAELIRRKRANDILVDLLGSTRPLPTLLV